MLLVERREDAGGERRRTPSRDEIEQVVKKIGAGEKTPIEVKFTKVAEAEEYRKTLAMPPVETSEAGRDALPTIAVMRT